MSRPGRPEQTSTAEWAQAALDELEQAGVAALSVERVARRLGVSKGGFYHRFSDRRALLAAALELWEERFARELADRFGAIPDPAARLEAIFSFALLERRPTVILRLMAAADDADVAATLRRATQLRLRLLSRTFAELGLAPEAADRRATLAYAAYLGLAQLGPDAPGVPGPEAMRAELLEVLRRDL